MSAKEKLRIINLNEFSAWAKTHAVYIAGFMLLAILGSIYLLSGGNAVVTAHDQLDQFYMPIYVEHFPDGYAPELAYGLDADEIQTTTWLFNPLYFFFDYAHAYLINYVFVMLVSYVGMGLLCSLFGTREWLAALSAIAFSLLPFYCTYGLSIMGMPLMFYCLYSYWLKPNKANLIKLLVYTLFFALGSGLVLVGYIIILIFVLCIIISAFLDAGNLKTSRLLGIVAALFILCAIYLWESANLFEMFFGSEAADVSHREEFENSPIAGGLSAVLTFVLNGQYHGRPDQCFIAIFAFLITLIAAFCIIRSRIRASRQSSAGSIDRSTLKLCKWIVFLFLTAVAIAGFYVIFNTDPVVSIRNKLPSFLSSFQFDRFYLLYPTIWYLLFGLCGELILRVAHPQILRFASIAAIIVVISATCTITLPLNDIFQTIERQIKTDEYVSLDNVTWNEFFGSEIFDEIKTDYPGIEDEGKTISVGIFPSIALYNGFECLDGYMASYPLQYKHEFRKIIERELDKSPMLADYFDKWGSRFYAFSSENNDYFKPKGSGKKIEKFDIDTEQFRQMGGKFIFSALPIDNASDLGITLLGQYDKNDVPYEIWLYGVND